MVDVQRQFEKLLRFDHLDKNAQVHLKKVYSTLACAMLAAGVGAYVHLFTAIMQAGFLSMIASLGFIALLFATQHNAENTGKRFGYLLGFSFCTGMGLGPLLDTVMMIDPSIIPTAFIGTSLIFICFTLSALYSSDRKWLYLGGVLFSGLSWMFMLTLANIFLRSQLLFEINLYVGLAIMCGFVLYDTQLIVEKRRRGDDDYIWHSVDLFIDFVQLFRRLLIILASKDNKKRNTKD